MMWDCADDSASDWSGSEGDTCRYETPEEKCQRLERAGWRFGDAEDFLARPETVPVERGDLAEWITILNTVVQALFDMDHRCLAGGVANVVDHIREYEED